MCKLSLRACAATMILNLLLPAGAALAGTVWLNDGSVVKGELVEIKSDHLVIDTGFADEISIDIDDIDAVVSTKEVTITFTDETERTGYLRKTSDGNIYLSEGPPPDPSAAPAAAPKVADGVPAEAPAGTDDPPAVPVPLPAPTPAEAAPVIAAPPPPPPSTDLVNLDDIHKMEQTKPYFWYESNIDLGVSAASGNTEQTTANISGAVRPRWGKNLVDIVGQANRQEGDDETTASNWRVQTTYTRALTTKWGASGFASFENDEKQDLDLRSTLGAGLARRVFDPPPTYLHVLLGLAYVNETYELPTDNPPANFDENRSYGAVRWELDYDRDIYTDDVVFYHNHRLTQGVIQETQFIALTTTGLDFGLIGDLSLKLEFQFDYNSQPAGNNDHQDQRYLVKLSYDIAGDETDWIK